MTSRPQTIPTRDAKRRERPPVPAGYWIIWFTVVIDLVGFGVALPVLGPYARDRFGASGTQVGLLISAYSLAQFLFSPILGRLSDRIGRKPVIIFSLVGTAIGSLVTGLAGALWVLFAARFFDGASGASGSVAQAAVADLAPADRRAALLGMLGAAFGIGFTLGPAIGGLASWLGGPRWPFYVAAGISGLNAIAAVVRLPETRPGSVPSSVGSAGSTDPHSSHPHSPHRHSPHAAADDGARSWRENGLPLLIGVSFASVFAFSAFEGTFSIFGKARVGFTQSTAGLAFVLIGLMVSVVQGGVVGRVVRTRGELPVLRTGMTLVAAGLLVMAAVRSWWLLVPALGLLCVGQGLASPTMSSVSVGRIAADRRGSVLGVQQSANALARVAGPAVGGLLFDHVNPSSPYIGGGVILFACVLTLNWVARVGHPGAAPTPSLS